MCLMRKKITFVSLLGVIILVGFNNCGEGFQSLNLNNSKLESSEIKPPQTNPALTQSNQIQINLMTKPESNTDKTDAKIEFEILNLSNTDQITCKLNSSLLDKCDTPIELENLTDGTQKFELLVNNGNCEKCAQTVEWNIKTTIVDTTPIIITLDSAPEKETRSTTASFSFSFSEIVNSMSCKLNGNDVANCSTPHTFIDLPVDDYLFEITVSDSAGNETVEEYSWKILAAHPICKSSASDPDGDGFGFENGKSCIVKKEIEPTELVLEFQFDKSGKGVIKYNKPVELDINFAITLKIDATERNFSRVFLETPPFPYEEKIQVQLKSGQKEISFSFENHLERLYKNEVYIAGEVTAVAQVHNITQNISYTNLTKSITYSGGPLATKKYFSTIYRSYYLTNSNKIKVSQYDGKRARNCLKIETLQLDGEPILLSDGGINEIVIYTNQNEFVIYNCIKDVVIRKKLPSSISIKQIVTGYDSGYFTTKDDRVFHFSKKTGDSKEVLKNISVKQIALSYSYSKEPVFAILDYSNKLKLYGTNLNKVEYSDVLDINSTHSGITAITQNGRLFNIKLAGEGRHFYPIDVQIPGFSLQKFVAIDADVTRTRVIFTDSYVSCLKSSCQEPVFSNSKFKKHFDFGARGKYSWYIDIRRFK